MTGNCREGLGEEFLAHIMAVPSAYTNSGGGEGGGGYGRDVESMPMVLQLGGDGLRDESLGIGVSMAMPLGLNLEPGFVRHQHQHQHSTLFGDNVVEGNDHHLHHQLRLNSNNHHLHHDTANNSSNMSSSSSSTSGITMMRDPMHMRGMYTALGQLHSHAHAHAQSVRPTVPSPALTPLHQHQHQHQPFHGQPQTPVSVNAVPHPPGIRPRVRARRGQATDPHSIAERLRRERIAERMRALQELVPSVNKTDKAAMLDEIVDYVKFLRLQVKVLSMSRLGRAGAIAQLVADVPLAALEGEDIEGGINQQVWDKLSNDATEQEVAKLMEENVGAAMQFLQSKALCIMPISLASAVFCTPQSEEPPTLIKPESNSHS